MKKWVHIFSICIIFFSCKKDKQDVASNVTETKAALNFKEVKEANLFAGKLMRIDSFPSQYIISRPVDVWLPENYSKHRKYSVLYMHDGQMLFDSTTTWNKQEWKVDEWSSKLMTNRKAQDFIVVAIHNIPKIRWQDLFPEKAINFIPINIRDSLRSISGKANFKLNGDNYLKSLVEEVKPLINQCFSVYSDKEHTFVMGSSMGGLMSMYALSEYPNVFGGASCISTHWPGAMPQVINPYPDAIFKYMETNFPKAGNHKVYFDYGNKTLDQYYPKFAPRVDAIFKEKGYSDLDYKNLFFEGTDHSEKSWNKRLDKPLLFLLGK